MANPYFQFKRFTVWHDKCAMKVGTDGVLLGAWAKIEGRPRTLDIGTGTGLIALMLAQRGAARIDAIDIDRDACLQAESNISRSPFAGQINVFHTSLAEYAPKTPSYDLIVSNPPYFVDSLKCPDGKRTLARHAETLPLTELLQGSRQLLADKGRLSLILPFERRDALLDAARWESLFPEEEAHVISRQGLRPKRLLITLTTHSTGSTHTTQLIIEDETRHYTDAFKALVQDFYLKM